MYLSSLPLIVNLSQVPNRENTLPHGVTNERIFKLWERSPEIFWQVLEHKFKTIS